MKNMSFQPLHHTADHLVCLISDDGDGENREYLCLLSATEMVEVNLKDNSSSRYTSTLGEPLAEYTAWKNGQLYQLGYRVCTFARFLAGQYTYQERLQERGAQVLV